MRIWTGPISRRLAQCNALRCVGLVSGDEGGREGGREAVSVTARFRQVSQHGPYGHVTP